MDPAALSLSQVWQYALEFTLLMLVTSAIGAALGSLLLLGVAGLVTEWIPQLRVQFATVHSPFHFSRVSKVQ
jgi:hypothetical protein